MNPKDRRKFQRIGIDNHHLDATLNAGSSKSFPQIKCRIVNISMDGLQIEAQYPVELQDVHLRVTDLENKPSVIRARPVYCERIAPGQFYIGLTFIGSNMDKYNFFSQLIEIDKEIITLQIDSAQNMLNKSSAMNSISDQ